MRLIDFFSFLLIVSLFDTFNIALAQPQYVLSTEHRNEGFSANDTLLTDQMVRVIEQSLALYYADYVRKQDESYEKVMEELNYSDGEIVEFSDEVYCERLRILDRLTPMNIDCNDATLSTIRFFASKRRGFVRLVLGRSKLYFDLYETKLSEYGLPLELKYLSVIESGLRPQVKSRAGALGLWQFMYRTGKMYDLNENSYIDERMDPEKATDAACRYLKHLHTLYGDWMLALAAYNAGPGNVNKAIRRSGNLTSYWDIRPFLPRETQGYIPNFIAAMYLLHYHAQHNIIPAEAPIHYAQIDTICLSGGVHFTTIARLLNYEEQDIKNLNPVYKHDFIPSTHPKQCISLPIQYIGILASSEDSLYQLEQRLFASSSSTTLVGNDLRSADPNQDNILYHDVQQGELLSAIAQKYNTTMHAIMKVNAMHSSNISEGQQLKIPMNASPKGNVRTTATQTSSTVKYYTVKSGDTFGKIAQRHGKSITQLKKLNPSINIDRLRLGQKIRVR